MHTNQKLIATYIISKDEMDYAEYCHFDMMAYKELLTYVLLVRDKYNVEYSYENYKHFLNEYKQAKHKYELCIENLLKVYATEFMQSQLHEVVLNFEEHTMSIYLKEFIDAEGEIN